LQPSARNLWEYPISLLVAPFRAPSNTYTGLPVALFRVQLNIHMSLLAALFRALCDRSVYSDQSQVSLFQPIADDTPTQWTE